MRRLSILLFSLLLTACETTTMRVLPVEDLRAGSQDAQASVEAFQAVSQAVGNQARTECRRRGTVPNCDFIILVDANPRAPANAFQTLDDDGHPVIIFTQAMIQSTQNADEMAFVMGHEAAHHVLGHIARQTENAQQSAVVFGDLARLVGAEGSEIEEAQRLGAQVGAQVMAKEFELEADRLGTIITYRAGYDPLVGAKFFDRIPDPGDRFLGSHPPNAQRVQVTLETARQLGLTP